MYVILSVLEPFGNYLVDIQEIEVPYWYLGSPGDQY